MRKFREATASARERIAMMTVISGLLVLTYCVMDVLVDRYLDAEISDSLRPRRVLAKLGGAMT